MRNRVTFALSGMLAVELAVVPIVGCGILTPTCTNESGNVLNINEEVRASHVASFVITSPKHNLVMRLTWADTAAILGLRATIVDGGAHVGCVMDTATPSFGPGGSSPTPQPWPAGVLEMVVDGTRGKAYRVEVSGDAMRDTSFTVVATYEIVCEG